MMVLVWWLAIWHFEHWVLVPSCGGSWRWRQQLVCVIV